MHVSGDMTAVLIAGATASGKSALALELAAEFGGVIINADSMQVYAELRIITNRPTTEEVSRVSHLLYGFRSMREPYSAALWLQDVRAALLEVANIGRLPIIVGGTGLYFKALTEGLSEIPPIPEDVRAHYRTAAQATSAQALYAELERRDPQTASRLRSSDTQRIVRALEVLEATNRPLSEWQAQKPPPVLPLAQTYPILVSVDRAQLYRRCDLRVDKMLAEGAVEEANAIAVLGLDPALPAMRAVGLPPLVAHARGEMDLRAASELAKKDTRNYAKRQLTWNRSNFISWIPLDLQQIERTKRDIDIFIRKRLTLRL